MLCEHSNQYHLDAPQKVVCALDCIIAWLAHDLLLAAPGDEAHEGRKQPSVLCLRLSWSSLPTHKVILEFNLVIDDAVIQLTHVRFVEVAAFVDAAAVAQKVLLRKGVRAEVGVLHQGG